MATTYTYQGGRKITLHAQPTRFISRASRKCLEEAGFRAINPISRHSWSIRSTAETIEADFERARRIAPAFRVYTVEDTGSDFLVTNRIFVRIRSGLDPQRFASSHQFDILKCLSPQDYLCQVEQSADVLEVVRTLSEKEGETVEFVDHDLNVHSEPGHFPNDPMFEKQWYFRSASKENFVDPCALVDCTSAWEAGVEGSEVVVGVIDCGCDLNERNFGGLDKFAGWALFGDGELCSHETCAPSLGPDIMYSQNTMHGTLSATLIAASSDTYGGVGAAPKCRLLPVRWDELAGGRRFSQSSFLDLIEFLRTRVDVVCCSWSTEPDSYWPDPVLAAIAETSDAYGLHRKGIVWACSAGNNNVPVDHESKVAIPFKVHVDDAGVATVKRRASRFTNSLSRLRNVLCTGAISSLGRRCHYANYGPGLGIVAPSSNAHLYGRAHLDGVDLLAPFGDEGKSYGGTSAAAALVAGVVALVRSANLGLAASEVVSILKRTADRELDMTPYNPSAEPHDPEPGWDISPVPPFHVGEFQDIGHPDGKWSPWFGFGKVNAGAAVKEALRLAGRPSGSESGLRS
jgi:subtilisin family serine protease